MTQGPRLDALDIVRQINRSVPTSNFNIFDLIFEAERPENQSRVFFGFQGKQSSGKSSAAMGLLAAYVALKNPLADSKTLIKLCLERIVHGHVRDLMAFYKRSPPGQPDMVLWDEAGTGMSKQDWAEEASKEFVKFDDTARSLMKHVLATSVSWRDLNARIQTKAQLLFDVRGRDRKNRYAHARVYKVSHHPTRPGLFVRIVVHNLTLPLAPYALYKAYAPEKLAYQESLRDQVADLHDVDKRNAPAKPTLLEAAAVVRAQETRFLNRRNEISPSAVRTLLPEILAEKYPDWTCSSRFAADVAAYLNRPG